MTKSHLYGHEIFYKENAWFFNNGEKVDFENPPACIKCKKYPTKEGYDPCIGYIENASSVCCGHGVHESIFILTEKSS